MLPVRYYLSVKPPLRSDSNPCDLDAFTSRPQPLNKALNHSNTSNSSSPCSSQHESIPHGILCPWGRQCSWIPSIQTSWQDTTMLEPASKQVATAITKKSNTPTQVIPCEQSALLSIRWHSAAVSRPASASLAWPILNRGAQARNRQPM